MDAVELMIRKVFDLDAMMPIEDGMGPEDIPEWDSLGSIRLLLEFEKTFGLSIPLEDMANVESVADLRRLLTRGGVKDMLP